MKYLHGHVSPGTAFVVDDYPYGFRLRCKIRYWIERTKNGERFCSQTTNPKRPGESWNKPKKGTYSMLKCLTQEDTEGRDDFGHIHAVGVNRGWDTWDKVEAYLIETGTDQSDPYVAEVIRDTKIITHANSVLTVTIQPASLNAEERERSKKESEEAREKAIRYGIGKTLAEEKGAA